MNTIDYVAAIEEDADTLLYYERSAGHAKERQRLQLLRMLKSGTCETMRQAASIVGFSHSTAHRHWTRYTKAGLDSMLALGYKGGQSRLSAEQHQQLDTRCGEGFTSLGAAKEWIATSFAVGYTEGGVWAMFERLGYKAKTGRPKHYKQDLEAQEEFKKNS